MTASRRPWDSLFSLFFPAGRHQPASAVIPGSVISIGESAFQNDTSLASVTIPASVTTIAVSAFAYCSALTSVTFTGNAPDVGILAFWQIGSNPRAYRASGLTGYGADGDSFNGLLVTTPV